MTTPPIRLAASYARTALDVPRQTAVQHEANAQHAASDGYLIPNDTEFRFSGCGISGLRDDRPELGRLVAALVDDFAHFRRLYIHDPSRLGRSATASVRSNIEYLLRRHDIEVVYTVAAWVGDAAAPGGRP